MMAMLASSNPLTHVVQHDWTAPLEISGLKFSLMSNQIFMMILAGVLLIGIVMRAGLRRRGRSGVDALVPKGFGNFIELICEYLREQVAKPALGEHTDRFIKFIWSVFFFVFTCNLLGLLPFDAVVYFITGMPEKPIHLRRHRDREHLGHRSAGGMYADHDGRQRVAAGRKGVPRALLSRPAGDGAVAGPGRTHRDGCEDLRADRATFRQHDGRAHSAGGASLDLR
jgi:hypothetical protein